MPETVDALILDLLEWIGPESRPYVEVIEAWRTSCPRLPVWEEANDRGLLEQRHEPGRGICVAVSAIGRQQLDAARPMNAVHRPVEEAESAEEISRRERGGAENAEVH